MMITVVAGLVQNSSVYLLEQDLTIHLKLLNFYGY